MTLAASQMVFVCTWLGKLVCARSITRVPSAAVGVLSAPIRSAHILWNSLTADVPLRKLNVIMYSRSSRAEAILRVIVFAWNLCECIGATCGVGHAVDGVAAN